MASMLEDIEFDENTAMLVVSDVHLGIDQIKLDDFKEVINEIASNLDKYKMLKAIILIGDIFDLMVSDIEYLGSKQEYIPLYDDLYSIKDRVKIIYALGNHEAPVPENEFSKVKHEIFKGLKNLLNERCFLDENNMCQYIVVNSTDINSVLWLYDTKKQAKNPGRTIELNIPLGDAGSDLGKKSLLVHGHQLLKIASDGCDAIWYMLWKAPDSTKAIVRKVWNRAGKGKYQHDKQIIEQEVSNIDDPVVREEVKMRLLKMELYEERKDHPHALSDDFKDDQVETFFRKEKEFKEVSTVLYGHTHVYSDKKVLKVRSWSWKKFHFQETEINTYNSGAWVDVDAPSFIGINASGHVKLYLIP